jgi:hypothetical protein
MVATSGLLVPQRFNASLTLCDAPEEGLRFEGQAPLDR